MEPGKTKKVTISAPEPRPEADKAKKIYRAIADMVRRHDDIMKQKRAYRDVFLPEAIMLRDRLQEYCERLMFFLPAEYGRKAEEMLWRKVYYEIIQLMKHNRKHMVPNGSLRSAFCTHLSAATGYYHHLLHRIQSELELSLEGIVDFYYVPEAKARIPSRLIARFLLYCEIPDRKPHHTTKAEPEAKVQQWAVEASHRCLVYLGDIARYQYEYDDIASRTLAQRYYYQALMLCPEAGMPHNQLGTLAGNSCYNLNAVYYYIRCLVSPKSFEGAYGNLARLFERNRRHFQELNQQLQQGYSPEQQRSKDVKRFVVRFLQLLDIFYTKSRSLDTKTIQELCQSTLHDFNLCMFSQPLTGGSDSSHCLTDERTAVGLEDEMVFKIIVICLSMIYLMQKDGNKQVAAVIAFSLALFSHILNHVMIRLQSAIYELENPRKAFSTDGLADDDMGDVADAEDDLGSSNTSTVAGRRRNTARNRKHLQRVMRKDSGKDANKGGGVVAADEEDKTPDGDGTKKRFQSKKISKLRRLRRRRDSSSSSEDSGEAGGGLSTSKNDSDLSEGEGSGSESGMETANHAVDNSSSEDTDDNLMVSQELRPGFGVTSSRGEGSTGVETLEGVEEEEINDDDIISVPPISADRSIDTISRLSQSPVNLSGTTSPSITTSSSSTNSTTPRPDSMPDMAECLRNIPLDWLSDAANLLSQTLKFSYTSADLDFFLDDGQLQSTRPVRVPPGFEKSSESIYVKEISEKLANFEIETDTDMSVYPTDTENSTVTESEMDTETETESVVVDRCELGEKRLQRLVQIATNEGLMGCIKIYCDWMRVNPHIIATCAKISSSLWFRLSVLLNFLPAETDLSKKELCSSDELSRMILGVLQVPSPPLTEDIHLRMFQPLEIAHRDLSFDFAGRLYLTPQQESILRIVYLRRFGYFITRLRSVQFTFEEETGLFYGPQQTPTPNVIDDRLNEQKMVDAEARRNQLMKDMAQLRLQAEVNQLEGSLHTADAAARAALPPYLIMDAMSICDHLQLIKQLATSSRFIIIIPLAVVDHLDFLKKDDVGARNAIRWLEAEFRKGNRYIRAQKPHEKLVMPQHLHRTLKKDKDALRFLQILECCKYLALQSPSCDLHSMVCLLTKSTIASPDVSIRTKEMILLAQKEGLSMQTAPQFHARWKEAGKNGKGT